MDAGIKNTDKPTTNINNKRENNQKCDCMGLDQSSSCIHCKKLHPFDSQVHSHYVSRLGENHDIFLLITFQINIFFSFQVVYWAGERVAILPLHNCILTFTLIKHYPNPLSYRLFMYQDEDENEPEDEFFRSFRIKTVTNEPGP